MIFIKGMNSSLVNRKYHLQEIESGKGNFPKDIHLLSFHSIFIKQWLRISSRERKRFFTIYKSTKEKLFCNSQILMTSNSFHQRFAKQTSSIAVTSDLFVVWYPGLWSKCHSAHGSFSGNPTNLQMEHIQLTPKTVLKRNSFSLQSFR